MEILHKAKRKDNGEWVAGFYCQLPKISLGATIIANGEMCAEDVADYIIVIKDKQQSNFSNGFPIEVVESEIYEIDPKTVCVYIGKDDDKGNKIFENDIVRNKSKWGDRTGVVIFENGSFAIKWKQYNKYCGTGISLFTEDISNAKERLGNVFDNPEMLERR